MGEATKPLRVVPWATGVVGTHAMRYVIEHPKLELVGVHVHSAEKEGRDAGELCGLAPIGVRATREIEAIIALKPDCVLYMQQGCNYDDVCRLLESGANIVTTRGEFHSVEHMPPGVRERVEAACRRGKSTIHSTGSSPGFVTELLPLALAQMEQRLDCLTIHEYVDIPASGCSAGMIFDALGYGRDPHAFDVSQIDFGMAHFGHSFEALAKAIGLHIDDIKVTNEVAAARSDVQFAQGSIAKGGLAAYRITVAGLSAGRVLMQIKLNWYCTRDVDAPGWDLLETGWKIECDGDIPFEMTLKFPHILPGVSASPPVHAIPYVCAASPGLKTAADLRVIPDLWRPK